MSRPSKSRLVANLPDVTYFRPEGIPLNCLEESRISIEEVEALRLKDIEGFEQETGAAMMHVSRPTFQRILASARRTIAEAILNGKAIRIEGGHYEMTADSETPSETASPCPDYGHSPRCRDCPRMMNHPNTPVRHTFASLSGASERSASDIDGKPANNLDG